MKVRWSTLALAELDAILTNLGSKHPDAAAHFEFRIRQIAERIGKYPQAFQEVAERPGIRRVPLVRYPYLVFYTVSVDEVIVVLVVHGAKKEPWENL